MIISLNRALRHAQSFSDRPIRMPLVPQRSDNLASLFPRKLPPILVQRAGDFASDERLG
jgi:hypothetical protein